MPALFVEIVFSSFFFLCSSFSLASEVHALQIVIFCAFLASGDSDPPTAGPDGFFRDFQP